MAHKVKVLSFLAEKKKKKMKKQEKDWNKRVHYDFHVQYLSY